MTEASHAPNKIRLIQAGVGGMGKTWWNGPVRASPDFELVAIVDVLPAALDDAGDALQIPAARRFATLDAALDSVPADALLTVTPPAVHPRHAEQAFARGLHVLCEKPIAPDLAQAQQMVEQGRDARRQLVIAQNYRYSAVMQQLRETVAAAPLGSFGHGHLDFYIPADFTGTFRETMQFPLLIDMAIHHLDLIRFITGRNISKVTAQTFNPNWSTYKHHAGLKMLLELDGGIPFSYSGDWTAKGKLTSWNGDWRLQFADGSIELHHARLTLHRCEPWGKNPTSEPIPPSTVTMNGQVELLNRFAAAIRENRPAETAGQDNLQSFAAVMAGVLSAEQGRTVQMSELLPG